MVCIDLGIPERYKPVIQKYIDFFGEKRRTQRFYDLEMENLTEETIEIALMSALCQSKVASFEEVVRILLTDDGDWMIINFCLILRDLVYWMPSGNNVRTVLAMWMIGLLWKSW